MKKLVSYIAAMMLLTTLSQEVSGQFLRAKVGTDFPLQYFLGLNYQQGKHVSFDLSGGIITSPYNNELYDVISVPERHKSRKEFLQNTTDDGSVIGLGANYNFGNWYAGIYGQRIVLNASATYDYVINSDLIQDELTTGEKQLLENVLNSPLPALFGINLQDEIELRMELYQVGIKFGRRFFFKNPRWEFRADISYSRNLSTTTTNNFNVGILDIIAQNNPDFAERLDFNTRVQELDKFFEDYGHIPTLNFGLSYLLYIPKSVKEQQQERNAE